MSYFDYSKSFEKVVRLEKSIVQNIRSRRNLSENNESLAKVFSKTHKK